jgi:hypothetical protein
VTKTSQQRQGTIAVLDTGGGDDHSQKQPERLDEAMALAAFHLFVGVKAAAPPFPVVLTD